MTRDDLLAAYARGGRDFARACLAGARLSGAYLSVADLRAKRRGDERTMTMCSEAMDRLDPRGI